MSDLTLFAPMQGWVAPLEETPDAVFAEKMLGDGVAIDPTGDGLYAPCAGQVISVHHTRHAVTLRAANGAEILMHIGLETVALGGEGFAVHVSEGQAVQAGDLLVSFNLDLLARRAKSLVSPIIITNGEAFEIVDRQQACGIGLGDALMTLRAIGQAAETASTAPASDVSRLIRMPLAHGIHARPAAVISAAAKHYAATVSLGIGDRRANAKSPVALMALGVRHNDEVTLSASGADAEAAVAELAQLIAVSVEELFDAGPASTPERAPQTPADPAGPATTKLKGVTAAPGLVIGVAARLVTAEVRVSEISRGQAEEAAALADALARVKGRIEGLSVGAGRAQRAILGAHLAFLDDPELANSARAAIQHGASAGQAWRQAVAGYVDLVRASGDARIAERVDDLVDLERQVLLALNGETQAAIRLPENAILLAGDLLPSQLMGLDPSRLVGVCTAGGGPTSHMAILAASMNIPALVAVGPGVLAIPNGAPLILDADAGLLDANPNADALTVAAAAIDAGRNRRQAARANAHEDCRMADGSRIAVLANLASLADAHAAVAAGAEGCGLLRTEFLFLDRAAAPDEEEQAGAYQAIADVLGERPLTIRTLDVGGDKACGYLTIPPEENPALGLRGVRVSLWRPDILRTQLRAILRVRSAISPKIMVPMVSSLDELTAVRDMVLEVKADLGCTDPVRVGVMVETPAAAITSDLLCAVAEFASIGTNDLSQYVLAMDRGNPAVAADVDGLHPAVLRLIAETVKGARANRRPVSVCGGLASDLAAAPILLGLGVTELSATPAIVPELKALIRTLTGVACADLAREALAQTSAADVRSLSIQRTRAVAASRGAA